MNKAKENILKRIRSGKEKANLWNHVYEPEHEDFFVKSNKSLLETFKEEFAKIDGEFIEVNTKEELRQALIKTSSEYLCMDSDLQSILKENNITFSDKIDTNSTPTGLIACEFLVARLGSVLTSSALNNGRQLNIFPEHQVVFAKENQLVYNIKDALEKIQAKYETLPSMISFATGPSRTADIEKTLILGAHGPKMLTIIFQNFS